MSDLTRVINIRYATGADDEVYIGRAGKGHDGYFGNPIRKGQVCPQCGFTHTKKGDTLPCYKRYLKERLKTDKEFRDRVRALKGKTLLCFCKPGPCHGDILCRAVELLTT